MLQVIECTGNPRDMGLDQGRACRAAVRAEIAGAGLPEQRSRLGGLAAFASGPVRGSGAGREILRHFTHLSERIDGLARSAGVPVDSLLELHTRLGGAGGAKVLGSGAVSLVAPDLESVEGVTVVRSLPTPGAAMGGWLARRSRPEVGFSSVEATLPWLVSAAAGVNEEGLCAAFVPEGSGAPLASAPARLAAPVAFLVQECLQRFDSLQGGLDWCASRPVAGGGTLLLAERGGEMAAVHFGGAARRVERPDDGVLVAGGCPGSLESMRDAALGGRIVDLKLLEAVTSGGEHEQAPAVVRLAARTHLFGLRSLGSRVAEISLEA